ncbi:hypothetical protein N7509_014052 [Penicillium cosmopolitanum]|uniref:Uncharacterized protein n=1 Tax=Penicillium cosmopolitanum TaxID=1131564 RepID=A0A9W9S032_9EURO|nr:uncharacterized protein N7509_014052 [Penicillium cosmopolitanum]KAJ5369440.1 hypothetical protein N7509_014052 [Penicillium cosmopolitanum]
MASRPGLQAHRQKAILVCMMQAWCGGGGGGGGRSGELVNLVSVHVNLMFLEVNRTEPWNWNLET